MPDFLNVELIMFRLLAAIIGLLVLSANFFTLGLVWIQDGFGLHPIVSFPLGTLTLCAVFWLVFCNDE